MKRLKVLVTTQHGRATVKAEVDGYDPGVSGLAVNRHIMVKQDGTTVAGKGWNVTHLGSGYRVNISQLTGRKQAEVLAVLLGDIADWTRPDVNLRVEPGLKAQVLELEDLLQEG